MYVDTDYLGPWSWLGILIGVIIFLWVEKWYGRRASSVSPRVPAAVISAMYAGIFIAMGVDNGILFHTSWWLLFGGPWVLLALLLPRYFEKDRPWKQEERGGRGRK